MPTNTETKKKPMSNGPSVLDEKACTLSSTPERVKNVPSTVNEKVAMASERFQTRKSPRRSWTMTEWM
jgi:hypothetical protein